MMKVGDKVLVFGSPGLIKKDPQGETIQCIWVEAGVKYMAYVPKHEVKPREEKK